MLTDFKPIKVLVENSIQKNGIKNSGLMNKLYTHLLTTCPIISSSSLSTPAYKTWVDLVRDNNGAVISLNEGQMKSSEFIFADLENYISGTTDIIKHLSFGEDGRKGHLRFIISKKRIFSLN